MPAVNAHLTADPDSFYTEATRLLTTYGAVKYGATDDREGREERGFFVMVNGSDLYGESTILMTLSVPNRYTLSKTYFGVGWSEVELDPLFGTRRTSPLVQGSAGAVVATTWGIVERDEDWLWYRVPLHDSARVTVELDATARAHGWWLTEGGRKAPKTIEVPLTQLKRQGFQGNETYYAAYGPKDLTAVREPVEVGMQVTAFLGGRVDPADHPVISAYVGGYEYGVELGKNELLWGEGTPVKIRPAFADGEPINGLPPDWVVDHISLHPRDVDESDILFPPDDLNWMPPGGGAPVAKRGIPRLRAVPVAELAASAGSAIRTQAGGSEPTRVKRRTARPLKRNAERGRELVPSTGDLPDVATAPVGMLRMAPTVPTSDRTGVLSPGPEQDVHYVMRRGEAAPSRRVLRGSPGSLKGSAAGIAAKAGAVSGASAQAVEACSGEPAYMYHFPYYTGSFTWPTRVEDLPSGYEDITQEELDAVQLGCEYDLPRLQGVSYRLAESGLIEFLPNQAQPQTVPLVTSVWPETVYNLTPERGFYVRGQRELVTVLPAGSFQLHFRCAVGEDEDEVTYDCAELYESDTLRVDRFARRSNEEEPASSALLDLKVDGFGRSHGELVYLGEAREEALQRGEALTDVPYHALGAGRVLYVANGREVETVVQPVQVQVTRIQGAALFPPPSFSGAGGFGSGSFLLREPIEILLGETQYFQAKPDPQNPERLVLEEVETGDCAAPQLDGGRPDATWFIGRGEGDKLGVYYDRQQWGCINSGGKLKEGTLAAGLIRVTGRFWEEGAKYTASLQVTTGYKGG